MRTSLRLIFLLAFGLASISLNGADWPTFRGPDLNGTSDETGLIDEIGLEGLETTWRKRVGTGFSSPSVADGKVFVTGNADNVDTAACFDEETGEQLWTHSWDSEVWPYLYEGGPNATPVVDGRRVYIIGRHGEVFALNVENGEVIWQKNLHTDLGLEKPKWGFTSPPLIHGENIILNAGTHGLALKRETGEVVWETGKGEAAYARPVPFKQNGQDAFVVFTPFSLAAVEAEKGTLLWEVPWRTKYKVNTADPIVAGDFLFASSGYDYGAALLKLTEGEPEFVYKTDEMRNHFSSCLLIDGYLYGVDGQNDKGAQLKCIELKTGEVKWVEPGVGLASLVAADGKLFILTGEGELVLAKINPEKFEELGRAQILGGKCWSPPALANGHIIARNAKGTMVRVKVTP